MQSRKKSMKETQPSTPSQKCSDSEKKSPRKNSPSPLPKADPLYVYRVDWYGYEQKLKLSKHRVIGRSIGVMMINNDHQNYTIRTLTMKDELGRVYFFSREKAISVTRCFRQLNLLRKELEKYSEKFSYSTTDSLVMSFRQILTGARMDVLRRQAKLEGIEK